MNPGPSSPTTNMPAGSPCSTTRWSAEIGGLLLGYSREKIFEMSDDELAATRPFMEKVVKNSRFLWKDPTELDQALASGEVVAGYAWNETIKTLSAKKIPVKYANAKEGIFTWLCGLTLLSTGKADEAAAYDFIDAWLSPETGKALIEVDGYGHSNMKAFQIADPKQVAELGIADPVKHLEEGIFLAAVDSKRGAEIHQDVGRGEGAEVASVFRTSAANAGRCPAFASVEIPFLVEALMARGNDGKGGPDLALV